MATLVFTGLRISEALALRWRDIDGRSVSVRYRLGKGGERVEPETSNAIRSVVLMPALGRVLREHRLRTAHLPPYRGASGLGGWRSPDSAHA